MLFCLLGRSVVGILRDLVIVGNRHPQKAVEGYPLVLWKILRHENAASAITAGRVGDEFSEARGEPNASRQAVVRGRSPFLPQGIPEPDGLQVMKRQPDVRPFRSSVCHDPPVRAEPEGEVGREHKLVRREHTLLSEFKDHEQEKRLVRRESSLRPVDVQRW
jgi:hypothetical protein